MLVRNNLPIQRFRNGDRAQHSWGNKCSLGTKKRSSKSAGSKYICKFIDVFEIQKMDGPYCKVKQGASNVMLFTGYLNVQLQEYIIISSKLFNCMKGCITFLLLFTAHFRFRADTHSKCSHLLEVITGFKWHIHKACLSPISDFRFLFTDPSFLLISLHRVRGPPCCQHQGPHLPQWMENNIRF